MISKTLRVGAASALVLAALSTGAVATSFGTWLENLLFAPTYDPRYVPDARGTRYDCRAVRASGAPYWRGLVGGRKFLDEERALQVSREACFPTARECQGYLVVMEGYIDLFYTRECRQGG